MNPFEEVGFHNEVMKEATCSDRVYLNDKYQVTVKDCPNDITWLSIKMIDKSPIHDWRDMQLIKNMLCGEEREGCEIYPKESRLVDTSNQYHIFVLPEGEMFPFGYGDRMVITSSGENTVQRKFKDDEVPKDAISGEEGDKLAKEYVENIRKSQQKN